MEKRLGGAEKICSQVLLADILFSFIIKIRNASWIIAALAFSPSAPLHKFISWYKVNRTREGENVWIMISLKNRQFDEDQMAHSALSSSLETKGSSISLMARSPQRMLLFRKASSLAYTHPHLPVGAENDDNKHLEKNSPSLRHQRI